MNERLRIGGTVLGALLAIALRWLSPGAALAADDAPTAGVDAG